jgi:hypothetical protein
MNFQPKVVVISPAGLLTASLYLIADENRNNSAAPGLFHNNSDPAGVICRDFLRALPFKFKTTGWPENMIRRYF